jgi:hypothetical protein
LPKEHGASSVTAKKTWVPDVTDVDDTVAAESTGVTTWRLAVLLIPPALAVKVTAVADFTVAGEIVTVALVVPAATVTDAGHGASVVLELVNETTTPADGAAFASVTVSVVLLPPATLAGDREIPARVGVVGGAGLTVTIVDLASPPWDAVNATGVTALTPLVFTTVFTLTEPAGIVTEATVDAIDPFALASATGIPPAGAAAVSEMVSVLLLPPLTVEGESESFEIVGGAVEAEQASFVPAPPYSYAPMSIAAIVFRTSPQLWCTYS